MPVTVILPARVILGVAILLAMATAQTPTASPKGSAQNAAGGTLVAELTKSVDAKSKPNDKIEARLTMDLLSHGEILVARGAKIIGHVIDAKKRTHDVPYSRIELAFDQIVMKNGHEVPLKASIQALGAPTQTLATSYDDSADLNAANQTRAGEAIGKNEMLVIKRQSPEIVGPTNSGMTSEESSSSTARVNVARSLGPNSRGIFRMKDMELSDTTEASAISSTRQNVHLDSGTQLVLHLAEPQVFADSLRKAR
jgi:hypothetical protein